MNKNINTVVELTEKELECVTGGGLIGTRFEVECPQIWFRPRPIR